MGAVIHRWMACAATAIAVVGLVLLDGGMADAGDVAGDLDALVEDLQAGGRTGYEVFSPLPSAPATHTEKGHKAQRPRSAPSAADRVTTRVRPLSAGKPDAGARGAPSGIRAIVHRHGGLSGTQALANDLIQRGTEALRDGAAERAVRLLSEGVRLDPSHARGHTNLGAAWLRMGRPREAMVSLETAVALDPDQAVAWNNLALAEWRNGSPKIARDHFLRAAEADPSSAAALANLALLQSQAGEFETALLTLRRALTRTDVPARAHLQLALLLDAAHRKEEAAAHLEVYLASADPHDGGLTADLHSWLVALQAAPPRRAVSPLASDE